MNFRFAPMSQLEITIKNKTPSAFVCDLTEVSYSKTERAVVVKGALLILTPDLSHALPLLCGPLVAPRCQF